MIKYSGTETALKRARARVDLARGYPRQHTVADRIGGGIHAPIEQCRTETACEIATDGAGALTLSLDAVAQAIAARVRWSIAARGVCRAALAPGGLTSTTVALSGFSRASVVRTGMTTRTGVVSSGISGTQIPARGA